MNTTTPNLNPSPKTRFRSNGVNISEHRILAENAALQRSLDFTMLEYQAQLALTVSENPNLATVAGMKMTGVCEFLQTFKTLSESVSLPSRAPAPNLDHKA